MGRTLLAAGMAALLLGFSACREEGGPSEQVDEAFRSIAAGTEETLLEISRELDDAVETGREVASDFGDQLVQATDDAIDAADDAIEAAEDAIGG